MKTFWQTITVDGGPMKLYVCSPDGPGPFPAVVVIQNQDGVAEFTQEMTRRVAEAGYFGAAPDLYHRNTPATNADHKARAAGRADAAVVKQWRHGRLSESARRRNGGWASSASAWADASLFSWPRNPMFHAAVDCYGRRL